MSVTLHLIPNNLGTHGTGLSLPVPVFAHVATPAGETDLYSQVAETVTGVVCGQCSDWRETTVRHATVAHVRECWANAEDAKAQMAAETWAEGAYDRWAEGGWDLTGAYSEELRIPAYGY